MIKNTLLVIVSILLFLSLVNFGVAKSKLLNINNASFEELCTLPGIDKVVANLIIDRRGKREFKTTQELGYIKGIGMPKLQQLLPLVTVE